MGPHQFISHQAREKRCHCKHSKCLQLYCECFASGNYCRDCDCACCLNTEKNDLPRVEAIRLILARNPDAFRPKIMAKNQDAKLNRQNRGCRCKKSHCLKKYCECFQAGIGCSPTCRCIDCKNGDSASIAARAAARDAATGLVSISEREREAVINTQYVQDERAATAASSSGGGLLETTLESLRCLHSENLRSDESNETGPISLKPNVDLQVDVRYHLSNDYISHVAESLKRSAKENETSWLSRYPLQSSDSTTRSSQACPDEGTGETHFTENSSADGPSSPADQAPPLPQQEFLPDLYSTQENIVLSQLLGYLVELADPTTATATNDGSQKTPDIPLCTTGTLRKPVD